MGMVYVLNGLYFSAFLFLTSLGLNIILGVMGVLNLAHGSLFAVGAFMAAWVIGISVHTGVTASMALGMVAAMLLAATVGFVLENTIIRPMYRRPLEYQLLITFGALLVIEDLIKLVWGGEAYYASGPFDMMGRLRIMGAEYPAYFVFVMGVTVLAGIFLWAFMARTRMGIMLRAIAMDRDMAEAMGISLRRLSTMAFMLGASLAGLAGALMVPTSPALLGIGMEPLIMAFIVVVIGGLGSLRGAVVGSLIVGQTRSFGVGFFPELEMPVLFLIAVLILVARPQGLFGRV
ncbi:MAG: branched-chain amino acid ABC transporter permease [Thermodesulfobacteriota bacterium]